MLVYASSSLPPCFFIIIIVVVVTAIIVIVIIIISSSSSCIHVGDVNVSIIDVFRITVIYDVAVVVNTIIFIIRFTE